MIQMTYREYFEKAKNHEAMKNLIIECFVTATRMIAKMGKDVDIGEAVLNSLSTMTKTFSGVELIKKDEITAEYMAGILNEYQTK